MHRGALFSSLFLVTIGAFVACSSSDDGGSSATPGDEGGTTTPGSSGGTNPDSSMPGTEGGGGGEDGGSDAPSGAKQTEKEPNNASSATDVNAMTVPGEMSGVIGEANDTDGFSVMQNPGDLWEWTLTPVGNALSPHLVVFDIAPSTKNPPRLVQTGPGTPAKLATFGLHPGQFLAVVRDARNVEKPPAGVGGPTFGYTLVAQKQTLNAVAATFPSTKSGTLASLGALDFYSFNGTAGQGFDIVIKAARKAQPSTLDSRISLFDKTMNAGIITNDDADGSTDSHVGGTFPSTGAYVLVVESEGTNPADLSYNVEFTLR